jgi:hypothetical protein
MNVCFPVAGLQAQAKMPSYFFMALQLCHNDVAVLAAPEIPWKVSL